MIKLIQLFHVSTQDNKQTSIICYATLYWTSIENDRYSFHIYTEGNSYDKL